MRKNTGDAFPQAIEPPEDDQAGGTNLPERVIYADRSAAIAALQQRIRACRLCEQHGYIPAAQPLTSGRASDRVMVIGQAPGHRSVANGRSFSGPGGRVLQKWLEQAGFPPGYLHEHAYLSSLTHCDPGRNPRGNGDRRPSPQEVALCRPFLDEELRLLKPKVVLLVGAMAIEAFLLQYPQSGSSKQIAPNLPPSEGVHIPGPKRSIDFVPGKIKLEDVVGTYVERDGMLMLPLPHPSGVSRWLLDPAHRALHQKALAILAEWRVTYRLDEANHA